MKDFKTLYGIRVPVILWDDLKLVADVLAKQSYTNISIREARKRAVVLALESFVKMTKRGKK